MSTSNRVRGALKTVRMTRASYDGRKKGMKKALVRAERRLGKALAADPE